MECDKQFQAQLLESWRRLGAANSDLVDRIGMGIYGIHAFGSSSLPPPPLPPPQDAVLFMLCLAFEGRPSSSRSLPCSGVIVGHWGA